MTFREAPAILRGIRSSAQLVAASTDTMKEKKSYGLHDVIAFVTEFQCVRDLGGGAEEACPAGSQQEKESPIHLS